LHIQRPFFSPVTSFLVDVRGGAAAGFTGGAGGCPGPAWGRGGGGWAPPRTPRQLLPGGVQVQVQTKVQTPVDFEVQVQTKVRSELDFEVQVQTKV
jgi:hypothetical protein